MTKKQKNKQLTKYTPPSKISQFFRNGLKNASLILAHILYRMKFIGAERTPRGGPAFIVANHVSYYDIPVIFWKVKPWVFFVAKHDLLDKPVIGPVIKWWEAIPINRDQPGVASVREIMGHIRANHLVSIFPEGTRIKSEEAKRQNQPKDGVLHFARKLNTPIMPMAIDGTFKVGTKVTVIAGKPFFLRPPEDPNDRSAVSNQAQCLMDYIYNMIDHPDEIEPPREIALSENELTPKQKTILERVKYGNGGIS